MAMGWLPVILGFLCLLTADAHAANRDILQNNRPPRRIGGGSSETKSESVRAPPSEKLQTPPPGPATKAEANEFAGKGSSCVCEAKATSALFREIEEVHTSAISKAIAITCEREEELESGEAFLFAVAEAFAEDTLFIGQAMANTTSTCKCVQGVKGEAFGCAYSEARSRGILRGFARAHARAIADVDTRCAHCAVGVTLTSDIEAEIFQEIVAQVSTQAFSDVCVEGTENRAAFANCVGTVIAKQFTYAFASAFLETDCVAEVEGELETAVEAYVEITSEEVCDFDPPKFFE